MIKVLFLSLAVLLTSSMSLAVNVQSIDCKVDARSKDGDLEEVQLTRNAQDLYDVTYTMKHGGLYPQGHEPKDENVSISDMTCVFSPTDSYLFACFSLTGQSALSSRTITAYTETTWLGFSLGNHHNPKKVFFDAKACTIE